LDSKALNGATSSTNVSPQSQPRSPPPSSETIINPNALNHPGMMAGIANPLLIVASDENMNRSNNDDDKLISMSPNSPFRQLAARKNNPQPPSTPPILGSSFESNQNAASHFDRNSNGS